MKILQAHNYYQQPGGEDGVLDSEAKLLTGRGHSVVRFTRHNDEIGNVNSLSLAGNTIWSRESSKAIRLLLQRERPDILHVHNTLPLLSPSVYYAARTEGVPVVQTLHNYRLICPNAFLFRDGRVCEECVGKRVALPSIRHACYHGSKGASGAIAGMLLAHRLLGTWSNTVDSYIALTDFAAGKFVEGGLPITKIVVKPNFLDTDPGIGEHLGSFAIFVGRLSPEKGLASLVAAWTDQKLDLRIVGDGPDRDRLFHGSNGNVYWMGRQPKEQVLSLMQDARLLIFPSVWYEGFPLTMLEAFATGLPVIASRLGSAAEIVEDGRTGLHFNPGDPVDLAAKIRWAVDHPDEMREMGRQARAEYELKYTAAKNYEMLISIYEKVIEEKRSVPV
jgi:glycosyltransferase involved in cell wall biosynthesis